MPRHGFSKNVLNTINKMKYPCKFDRTIVQRFSFIFTNIESQWTFGFCRHDPKSETALVILSYLPWHESFYKLLNCISNLTKNSKKSIDLLPFLESVYNSKLPITGCGLNFLNDNGEELFVYHSPNPFKLPSIPENNFDTSSTEDDSVNSSNYVFGTSYGLATIRCPMDTKDLIRLDSTSIIDEFDPLKSHVDNKNGLTPPKVGFSNPLYHYLGLCKTLSETENKELLKEYGLNLDLLSFSHQSGSSMLSNQTSAPPLPPKRGKFKLDWTKFK